MINSTMIYVTFCR